MILVFAKHERDFKDLNLRPKNKFKRVFSEKDIFGCDVDGVVFTFRWHESNKLVEAYEYLISKKPEFKL